MDTVDISELDAVDHAIGRHLAAAIESIDKDKGSRDFQLFLKRAPMDQIARGLSKSPSELARKVTRKSGMRRIADKELNSFAWPMVYYYREIGMGTADGQDTALHHQPEFSWLSPDNLSKYDLTLSEVKLRYRIMIGASSSADLERLLLAWHFYLSKHTSTVIAYRIQGQEFHLPVVFDTPKQFQADDISVELDEGRLFAVELVHEVLAPVLSGHEVDVPPIPRIELTIGTIA